MTAGTQTMRIVKFKQEPLAKVIKTRMFKFEFSTIKMITIKINNQPKDISENSSVANLLSELDQPENGIAVAINQQIITKTNWETKELNNGDDILIIQATQGG